jgi:hypothetical protein
MAKTSQPMPQSRQQNQQQRHGATKCRRYLRQSAALLVSEVFECSTAPTLLCHCHVGSLCTLPVPRHLQGDLHVRLELQFPASLTPAQKGLIKAALLLPAKLSERQQHAVHAFEAAFNDVQHGWSTGFTKQL